MKLVDAIKQYEVRPAWKVMVGDEQYQCYWIEGLDHDQMVKFRYTKVYAYRGDYFDLIPDAVSITEEGFHRFDMCVSLSFKTKIKDVLFEWSIDTEKAGSNGTAKYNFDWDLLQKIYDLATGDNKKFVDNYIQRCQEAVSEQSKEKR